MSGYDIIFAGAGHNNLVTAAYAAKAGFRVLVLEGAARIGGNTTCEELTLPGYVHDPCATAHNLIQSNPLMRNNELDLDRYGLTYLSPDPVFTMPFLDGASITMWRDLDRTCAELARFSPPDAKAYRELLADWDVMAPVVNAERAMPPQPPNEVDALTRQSALGDEMLTIRRATALDIIKQRFREDHVRAFFAWIAFMTLHPLDESETGLMAFSLVAGRQRFSWIVPEGGSIQLPMALARIIDEHGGTILTSKPIVRIDVENGHATAVETSDGARYEAGKAIVSTIHVKHLGGLVGEEHLPDAYRAGVARWEPNLTMFATHYATSEAPRFNTERGAEPSVTVGALESLEAYDAMLAAYRSGRIDLKEPVFLALTPTVIDPSRAPAGRHTFKLVSFLPYELAEGPEHWDQVKGEVSNVLFDRLARLSPNLSKSIVLAEHVNSPLDLERRNPANWRGSCHGGANSPEQSGYFRPVEGWSSYRTPVAGLYQNGACTHPGGSVSGLPGRNCAGILLQDLGSSLQEAIARRDTAKP
ncbi:MAG TPA: NAD(P)/FAD-dependent oxidoreductase [Candidatus Dormibacteraeota bacterium]|jgi:phytoene dehydrogenase-like protein|nr:NAD(P)/FAD-dependent oxidoreductase [Candidatus Dormibacteraeota bacterium]